jgi:predicted phage tail protein
MIKLTIYGRLRKFIGQSTFEIAAKSPKDAFSFLLNNFKGLREHIKDQEYCVMAGDLRVTEELLDMYTESDIKIVPVVHGEVWWLAAAFLGGGATAAAIGGIFTATVFGVSIASALTTIGVTFLISGVTDLLTPDPVNPNLTRQEDPNDPSFSFTGLLNNSKQGVPINIAYGEILIGSTLVSSSVDTFQVVAEA